MSLMKVRKGNNGNTESTMPSVFDPDYGLRWPSMFDSFARPLFRRGLLDDFFEDNLSLRRSTIGTAVPAVNIEETDKDLVINVAAPGMKKNDFVVEIDNDQLHIAYKKEMQDEKKDSSHWRREFNFESFDRYFTLPAIVERDQIEATYVDGILKITVPKKEEARKKPAKMIEIK